MEQSPILITFTPDLTSGTISPSAPQYAGVQGDHRTAEVQFAVPEALRGDTYRYRIEGLDGAGGYVTSELLPLDDNGKVAFLLPAAFTQAGGQLLVRLVVTELADGEEVSATHTFDGRLYFADAPAPMDDSLIRGSVSAMLAETRALIDSLPEMCEPKWLSGIGAPTPQTVGTVGQFYRNRQTGSVYECIGTTGNVYYWVKLIRQSDIATAVSPGVVAVSNDGIGGLNIEESGLVSLCPATQSDIDSGAAGANKKRPITPENLDYALRNKADKVTETVIDLTPVNWVGTTAPFTYVKNVPGMTASKKISVALDATMNAVKRAVARQAMITCTEQGSGTLTFVADGEKPTQLLSVIVREVG